MINHTHLKPLSLNLNLTYCSDLKMLSVCISNGCMCSSVVCGCLITSMMLNLRGSRTTLWCHSHRVSHWPGRVSPALSTLRWVLSLWDALVVCVGISMLTRRMTWRPAMASFNQFCIDFGDDSIFVKSLLFSLWYLMLFKLGDVWSRYFHTGFGHVWKQLGRGGARASQMPCRLLSLLLAVCHAKSFCHIGTAHENTQICTHPTQSHESLWYSHEI